MAEFGWLFMAAVGGGLLGCVYFQVLWHAIHKGLAVGHGALWFAGGSFLRLAGALAGFFMLLRHDWRSGVSALAGFMALRVIVTLRAMRTRGIPCT